ncbi:hypothetical protein [Nostoc sp. LPT]|uniref:hypothetical protein n=1 Tax=Nostoc sp. LPT TaxID=2815387 RepID=UPI001D6BD8C8|nr:hypothetical protein [Nostoc sp. LPT]MBN4002913.1 hypothetical protein [Nostoc sp. LPT]
MAEISFIPSTLLGIMEAMFPAGYAYAFDSLSFTLESWMLLFKARSSEFKE